MNLKNFRNKRQYIAVLQFWSLLSVLAVDITGPAVNWSLQQQTSLRPRRWEGQEGAGSSEDPSPGFADVWILAFFSDMVEIVWSPKTTTHFQIYNTED